MVVPDLQQQWQQGRLLSVSDGGCYLLIELPHHVEKVSGAFFGGKANTAESRSSSPKRLLTPFPLSLGPLVSRLMQLGVRPILAHPERHAELLHGNGAVDDLIMRGCLVQVSAENITDDRYPELTSGLRSWARRGVIHLIGSDGHNPLRRPPGIAAAYDRLATWAGAAYADRVCSTNGIAILEGLSIQTPRPAKRRRC
jgi:protein-tyrosine phosphatase